MPTPRDVLTPSAFAMLQIIAETGSFAAAARSLNMVPSALSYRVRQMEEALDVLLFDRGSRQAKLTAAGAELLRESVVLIADIDAVANRIKRVATGWEPQFTISVDNLIERATLMELCAEFLSGDPPTRVKLRFETLSGTLEALALGQADLAIGVATDAGARPGIKSASLGTTRFAFAVAPNHALARAAEPLTDVVIRQYRAVALADSALHGSLSRGLLPGQDVFTVTEMDAKLDAHLRGIGVGFLPACLAQPHFDSGRLVARRVDREPAPLQVSYAWRDAGKENRGRALQWWLARLESPVTRAALLGGRTGIG
jgi:DNA-binding transcriptional LysR family regulator